MLNQQEDEEEDGSDVCDRRAAVRAMDK